MLAPPPGLGASGIHVGTMSFDVMVGDAFDKSIAFMSQDNSAAEPYYHQDRQGMQQTAPIITGGVKGLRLPAFFVSLDHPRVILIAGGGSIGHEDGPKQGAASYRQREEAWKLWMVGVYGDISLPDGIVEYAKTHEDVKWGALDLPEGRRPEPHGVQGKDRLHGCVVGASGDI